MFGVVVDVVEDLLGWGVVGVLVEGVDAGVDDVEVVFDSVGVVFGRLSGGEVAVEGGGEFCGVCGGVVGVE